jgi:hypothetical protein
MPVPATTGQLRTKISDMQIGDYIAAWYIATGDNIGLGTNGYSELPLTGVAASSGYGGYFYWIKVAKGLLVADRVVVNTYSWDALNSAKLIQGKPWDTGNIIPAMTSNTSPSGVASASSELSSNGYTYPAWKAFDKVDAPTGGGGASVWASNGSTGWLAYDFGTPKVIKKYTLLPNGNPLGQAPKTWTFEGSNDGVNWTILDTQVNITNWQASTRKSFIIRNSTAYSKYRINISANNGDPYVSIAELEMMETAGIIRSLTGGVAYADANGNKAITDQGKGGWPVNNEWDKYIVNFPQELIQSGKTLDDVFHFMNIGTWTQDTPMAGMTYWGGGTTNSSHRVYRGYYNVKTVSQQPSSFTGVQHGFRPVFEYIE